MKTMKNHIFTKLVLLVFLAGCSLFLSCNNEEEEQPVVGDPPVANAGEDQEVSVGSTVTLDGSGSFDPDNDALSYSWQLTQLPSGSAAAINPNDQPIVSFTPDIEGTYVATLSVNDGNNEDVTDEVIIIAEIRPQIIDASISEDVTWENVYDDPSVADYRVIRRISIDEGATLNIAPGVIVEFSNDAGLDVNGAVIADGTAADSIIFTGENKSTGFWRGIAIYSPDVSNLMNYVKVEYGGSSEIGFGIPRTNVGVEFGDRLTVTNLTFQNSAGYGLFFETGGIIEGFNNNYFSNNNEFPLGLDINNIGALDQASTFENNAINEVAVFGSTLENTSETEWKNFSDNTSFRVLGNLAVNAGLLISEGTTLKFASDVGMEISGEGYLIARGTGSSKVTFTGVTEVPGFWKGISFFTGNVLNELDHVVVSYGGSSRVGFGIPNVNVGVEFGDRLSITNSEIFGSSEWGVYCEDGSILTGFSNNILRDNGSFPISLTMDNAVVIDEASTFNTGNGDNSVNIIGDVFDNGSTESTLVALSNNTPYYLTGNLNIQSGLVINDGVIIEVGTDNSIQVNNEGYLIADGSDTRGISFTGKTKAAGAWKGIAFYTPSTQNLMNYVTISHGGSSPQGFGIPEVNVGVEFGDRLTITNCTITDSNGIGLFGEAGSIITQSNNTFSNNVVDIELN
jgi:hypothetical protein